MNKDARVSWFTMWTFVFFGVYCWALTQAWVTLDARWVALCFASIGGSLMLMDRKKQHDELCQPSIGILEVDVKRPEVAEEEVRPQVQSENGNRIRYAKFALTRKQWSTLAHVLIGSGCHVTRDIVAKANVFTNLTKKWPGISAEFERLGWTDGNELTDAGKEWFTQFLPPLPHSK